MAIKRDVGENDARSGDNRTVAYIGKEDNGTRNKRTMNKGIRNNRKQ